MSVIAYIIRGGQKSWIASYNGTPNADGTGLAKLRFTSLISDGGPDVLEWEGCRDGRERPALYPDRGRHELRETGALGCSPP